MSGELLLLGAGASVEAGVPAATALTQRLLDEFEHEPAARPLLRFVVGGLQMQRAARDSADPLSGIDVEALLRAIDLLAERSDLEMSAFVGAWHDRLSDLERSWRQDELKRQLERAAGTAFMGTRTSVSAGRHIRAFTDAVLDAITPPTEPGWPFQWLRAEILKVLVRLLDVESPDSTSYLTPLVTAAHERGVTVGTLNYDRTTDLAAERADIPVDDGMAMWEAGGRLAYSDGALRVLRMHGYVGWVHIADYSDGLPASVVRRRRSHESLPPAVIFGERNKLRPDGPYLDLFTAFREALQRADRLVVVGYSFRDAHINESIATWLRRNSSARVTVVDPAVPTWQDATTGMGASMDDRFIVQLMRAFGDRITGCADAVSVVAGSLLSD